MSTANIISLCAAVGYVAFALFLLAKWARSSGPADRGKRRVLDVIASIVGFWYGYIDLHSWALAAYVLIVILTGNLFTMAGLVLAWAVVMTVAVFFLNRWLNPRPDK